MDKSAKQLIDNAVLKIIKNSSSEKKLKKFDKKHTKKTHFIPKEYRIFAGVLQSMNIQFGNFIETLMEMLISNEANYEICTDYSGKKSNNFKLSQHNDSLIDSYITHCQDSDYNSPDNFNKLLNDIIKNCNNDSDNDMILKHDIDLLFKNTENDITYYLEIKYNDDHDTGKFVDINRKFIKTYAYLVKYKEL